MQELSGQKKEIKGKYFIYREIVRYYIFSVNDVLKWLF